MIPKGDASSSARRTSAGCVPGIHQRLYHTGFGPARSNSQCWVIWHIGMRGFAQSPYTANMITRFLLAFLCASGALLADQVTMKNGDHLSGSIVKYDGKNLILKSEFAGQVTIPWDAVTAITSSDPLNVGLKDGQ